MSCAGGSPYQIFQNQREAAARRLAAGDHLDEKGRWRKEFREQCQTECKESWAGMSDDEKKPWRDLYQSRLQERKRSAESALGQTAGEAESFEIQPGSHWSLGTSRSTLGPSLIQSWFDTGGKMPRDDEVFDPSEFRADPPAPPLGELLGKDIVVEGCPLRAKNMCAHDHDRARMDHITGALSRLVNSAGKPLAKSGDLLIMFESLTPPFNNQGQRARLFMLVTTVTYRPYFQDLTHCVPVAGQDVSSLCLSLPLEIEIETGRSRLSAAVGSEALCIRHSTSDEVAKNMVLIAAEWKVQALRYEVRSVMRMCVTGARDDLCFDCAPLPPSARAPRRSDAMRDLMQLDDLDGDPLALRSSAGARPRGGGRTARRGRGGRGPPAQPVARRLGDAAPAAPAPIIDQPAAPEQHGWPEHHAEQAGHAGDIIESDEDIFGDGLDWGGGPTSETRCDIGLVTLAQGTVAELGNLHRSVEDTPDCGEGASGGDAPGATGTSAISAADGVDLAGSIANATVSAAGWATHENTLETVPPPPTPAPPPPQPNPLAALGAPEGWTRTPQGHIFDAQRRKVGRLTSWKTNVSMKCDFHRGCSLAKGRATATDEQLLAWLSLGAPGASDKPPTSCSEHHALWNSIVSKGSGSASSSNGPKPADPPCVPGRTEGI